MVHRLDERLSFACELEVMKEVFMDYYIAVVATLHAAWGFEQSLAM